MRTSPRSSEERLLTETCRRWIRLLFGREFEFDDMLRVWDRIFAEDASPAIIDLVCLSMLLRIRWQREFPERISIFRSSANIT